MKKLLGVAAAAMIAVGAGPAHAETFKIGLVADFTGIFATWGTQFQQAVEAFQMTHGKSVKGPKGENIDVKMIYRDSSSQGPEKAKQLSEAPI